MARLAVTPRAPSDIRLGAMLDIASLPDEYAVLVAVDTSTGGASVVVRHQGDLHSLFVQTGDMLDVISYVDSNALETNNDNQCTGGTR